MGFGRVAKRRDRPGAALMGRFRHCPGCGALLGLAVSEGRERDRCPGCGRTWYENAKPCAGALVVDAGRLLLVKRAIEPFFGHWDVPGGFLEADEHPEDGARREVFEETGVEVAIGALLGMYVDTYRPGESRLDWHHTLNIFYLARPIGGALRVTRESSDARWFGREDLPPLAEIAYDNGRRAIADWLARPVDF